MFRTCARCGRANCALFESPAGDLRCSACLRFAGQGAEPDPSMPGQAEPPGSRQGVMTEPTDAEMLAKVNEALHILEVQLASAEATEAAAGQRLVAAEARLAALLVEPASAIGAMPMNGGGYRYTATPPSVSARRLDRAERALEVARRQVQVAASVIFGIRLKRNRLLRAQQSLQDRQGAEANS
jgi:hypothetical protein